ncbi:zinc-dependent alcohol dehydrogenase family protein [Streptomyces sp. NPDC048409]|uniref:zinc-dependent alcohol dehydrogenase family protein n=1 Tax=Streptomyces sp. NPDC048409 TaxID=3154723 RepID=UPI0034357CC0
MSRLVMRAVGPVDDVVHLEDEGDLRPEAGEVLVDMEAANINLTDFRQAEGTYTDRVRSDPPRPLGGEGAGRITALGPGVEETLLGRRVIVVPTYDQGTWAHRLIAPLHSVYPVGEDTASDQLAMLASNPATAHQLLHRYVDLKPGDWVIQDMANSAAGQYVIQLASEAGVRTLNIVRRPEAAAPLHDLGADAVLVDGADLTGRIARVLGEQRARLVLDGVGGELPGRLAAFAEDGATVVSYSSLTRTPVAIPAALLVYRELQVRGFWIVNWLRESPRADIEAVYASLDALAAKGRLTASVQDTFALHDYRAAFDAARRPQRSGKVVFDLTLRTREGK